MSGASRGKVAVLAAAVVPSAFLVGTVTVAAVWRTEMAVNVAK